MKKMMMFLAVAVIAGAVQAANVSWLMSNIKDPTNLSINLATGSNVSLLLFLSPDGNIDWTLGGGSTGGDSLADTGALTAAGSMGLNTVYDATAAKAAATGGNLSFYAVVLYTDPVNGAVNTGNATYYYLTTLQTKSIANIDSAAVNFAWSGSTTMVWTAVPEPTSLALLGLGVAALGLRRKFRK